MRFATPETNKPPPLCGGQSEEGGWRPAAGGLGGEFGEWVWMP